MIIRMMRDTRYHAPEPGSGKLIAAVLSSLRSGSWASLPGLRLNRLDIWGRAALRPQMTAKDPVPTDALFPSGRWHPSTSSAPDGNPTCSPDTEEPSRRHAQTAGALVRG